MLLQRRPYKNPAPTPPKLSDVNIGGSLLTWDISADYQSAEFSLVNACGDVVARAGLPTDAIQQAKYRLLPYASEISITDFEEIAILVPVAYKHYADGVRTVIDNNHFLSAHRAKDLQNEALRVYELPNMRRLSEKNAFSVKFVSSALSAFNGGIDGVQVLQGGGMRPVVLFDTDETGGLTTGDILSAAFELYLNPPVAQEAPKEEAVQPVMAM